MMETDFNPRLVRPGWLGGVARAREGFGPFSKGGVYGLLHTAGDDWPSLRLPPQNLSTFVNTWVEPEALELMTRVSKGPGKLC